jgi:hypothetical protein
LYSASPTLQKISSDVTVQFIKKNNPPLSDYSVTKIEFAKLILPSKEQLEKDLRLALELWQSRYESPS